MPFQLIAEDESGRRPVAEFRPKESVTVGRTSAARCEFPKDARMSGLHAEFVATDDGRFAVRDLHSTNGTFVGKRRVEAGVPTGFSGDDEVLCGQTRFRVAEAEEAGNTQTMPVPKHLRDSTLGISQAPLPGGEGRPPAAVPADAAKSVAGGTSRDLNDRRATDVEVTTGWLSESAAAVAARFGLEDAFAVPPEEGEATDAYLDRLAQDAETTDALVFAAYALPKRLAVWWAVRCVQSVDGLSAGYEAVLDEAVRWVETTAEADRREAFAAAEESGLEHAACWPAVAAFWADGSLGPVDVPEIPAADDLCGKAASTAATLAAVADPPQDAPKRRAVFVALAHEVAAADEPWAG